MDIRIPLTPTVAENCEIISSEPGRIVFRTLSDKASLLLPEIKEKPSREMLLTCKVSFDGYLNRNIMISFRNQGNACFYYNVALMPTVKADLIFRLKYLDGNLCFPPMEESTLKSSVSGSMKPSDIDSLKLLFRAQDVTFTLEDLRFTDTEPIISDSKPMCDEFGQCNARDWIGKTHSIDELRKALDSEIGYEADEFHDSYGGDKRCHIADSSDSFRTMKHNGRWWLVTPDGNAFFSTGVFGVYPGEYGWVRGNERFIGELPSPEGEFADAWTLAESEELYRRKFSGLFPADTKLYSFATANLIRAYGSEWRGKWTELTISRLHRWSINTLSMFSDPNFIKESKIPYVVMLKRYPTTKRKLYRELPDVFDPEFERGAVEYAKQLAEYAQDKSFIGYFMNNEPTFLWDEPTLHKKLLTDRESCSRQALVEWLRAKYQTIERLNEAWESDFNDFNEIDREENETAKADMSEFAMILVRRFTEIPARECRKVAGSKLNLGMRFAGINKLVLGTVDLFDVYSFNRYGYDPTDKLDEVARAADKPILIGEFHFGATDAGLPAGGMINATTQTGRAKAYKSYMRAAKAHPNCVGAHWFAWNDQPLWGRYDCENYGFGMVDICNRAYGEFTSAVAEANREATSAK